VQLDEPWLATLVDPRFRAEERIEDVNYEMDLCADLLNQTLDGLGGIATAVHLCHAHFARQHKTEGPYDLIMPALARVRVDTISLELAGYRRWTTSVSVVGGIRNRVAASLER